MENILIPVIIALLAIASLFLLFVFVATFERKMKIQRLRSNLSYFPPKKILDRLDSFNDYDLEERLTLEELRSKINETCKLDYIRITKLLDSMEIYATPLHFFSILKFRSLYLELFEKMAEYQSDYLDVRFALFDLTSDIEVEKAVLKKLKEQANHVIETISYSPIDRIRDSKKIEAKVTKLRTAVSNMEYMIEHEGLHLTAQFVEAEEKLGKMIESLATEVDFMKHHIEHLENNLQLALKRIVKTYKKHEAILVEVEPTVKKYTHGIKKLKNEIREDIDNIKVKDARVKMETLNKLVNELHLIVNSNVDYAKFNNSNDFVPSQLLLFIKENHMMFISEIKRHRLNDEQTRLQYVQNAYSILEDKITKYEYKKMDKFVKETPEGINALLMDVVHHYKNYIDVVFQNVKDISEVNASTNDINMEIARMNTALLQVEYNIISLRGHQKDNLEKEKEALQKKVKQLRDHFRDNTSHINENAQKAVQSTKEKVDDLVNKSRGTAFEIYFLKETLLYINRFKGNEDKMDLMIESANDSYNDEKYTEALRKAKEIIDIYGIK